MTLSVETHPSLAGPDQELSCDQTTASPRLTHGLWFHARVGQPGSGW